MLSVFATEDQIHNALMFHISNLIYNNANHPISYKLVKFSVLAGNLVKQTQRQILIEDSCLFLYYILEDIDRATDLFPNFVIEISKIYGSKKMYKMGMKLFEFLRTKTDVFVCSDCGEQYHQDCKCGIEGF